VQLPRDSGNAAYLVFLSIKALQTRSTLATAAPVNGTSAVQLFRDGCLVALLNPKTSWFLAALLPQFINSNASPLGQSLIFGSGFVSIAMCTDTIECSRRLR